MFDRHYAVWPARTPKNLPLPQTSIYTNLAITALRYPEKTAIDYYGTPINYRELNAQVERLAGYLQQQGVERGDRVLLYMQNSPQFVIGYYAILRADAMVVPINPMNRAAELRYYVEDTGAKIALCGQELYPNMAPLLDEPGLERVVVAAYSDYVTEPTDLTLPAEVSIARQPIEHASVTLWTEALSVGAAPRPHRAGPDDYCVLPYSSGTTGNPKGCLHTHRSVMATAVQGCVWQHTTANSVVLATLPLFHVTGMQGTMNSPIYLGATVVMMTRWDRRVAAELIQRHRVTGWTNISTMVVDLLADPEIGNYDLSSLQIIGGGGAAMPKAVEAKLHELTGLHYMEGYGLSETIAGTHINPPGRTKAQCLGIPVFDVDSRIVDLDTLEELPPGEVGEIITHAPQVFQGYWNRPEETDAAFVEIDGKRFFRTGDLGYYDEEGYFFLVDRVKRMINASGYKVWPSEVESLMYAHPAIREVCIIASPHPRRGETVKAMVVLKEDQQGSVDEQGIIDWCRENMAAYKVPQAVEFVESLPKSPTGKLMWRQLQEQEREKRRAEAS